LEAVLAFKPDLLAVSAGFDAYKEDPIAGLKLDRATFKTIGSLLAQTKLPRFATLEGGYSEDLPKLVESFLDGFF
jgi:acetoin utilization deacetylase AcuC-like enzyme